MLKFEKPSVRNFAILESIEKTRFGSTYAVQDRRSNVKSHLFVPSRLRAWPRYLELFTGIDVTAVRLRNGRVALLLPVGVDVRNQMRASKKVMKQKNGFNALIGFEVNPAKQKRRFASALIGLSSCLVAGLVWQGTAEAKGPVPVDPSPVKLRVDACSNTTLLGQSLAWSIGQRDVLINGERIHIGSAQQLGGFLQLQMVSECDHKSVHVSAWLEGKQFRITSVN